MAVISFGCGKQSQTPTNNAGATETPAPIDSSLQQTGYVRGQLTDPTTYSYNQSANSQSEVTPTINISQAEQKMIGQSAQFNKVTKYNISGLAQIIAVNQLRISSFSYNGGCGPVVIGLAISNNITKPLAKIQTIATPVSDAQYDIAIPSNISLTQFNTVAGYCSNNEQPITTASF